MRMMRAMVAETRIQTTSSSSTAGAELTTDYPLANAATTANAVTTAQVCLPQEVCECRGGGGWVPAVQEQDKLRHLLLPPHGGLGGPALGQPGQAHQRGPKRPIQKEIFVSKYQTPQFKVPIRTMALSLSSNELKSVLFTFKNHTTSRSR